MAEREGMHGEDGRSQTTDKLREASTGYLAEPLVTAFAGAVGESGTRVQRLFERMRTRGIFDHGFGFDI
jgi:hypothetical protein